MIVRYIRQHTVQPESYESISFGAQIEVDLDTDPDYKDHSLTSIGKMLDEDMDTVLATAVDRALASDGNKIETTHLWSYYERD